MKRILTILGISIANILTAAVTVEAQSDDPNCKTVECLKHVSSVRRATAKYHEFAQALSDGFIQASPCVEVPGLGAMGFHFVNPARIDLIANPAEPEVLLYLPDSDGVMRLIGVEYSVPDVGQGPPTLFGLPMQGPFDRGNGPAYERHAWIWRRNPAGMFQPFNPSLSCP